MGIIRAVARLLAGDQADNLTPPQTHPGAASVTEPPIAVNITMGAAGSIDQQCKPGKFYVYVHKDARGTVFYVGKGTGDRAYSRDRGADWNYYVDTVLGGHFTVQIVREGISDQDALLLEDLLMQQHGATIINLQNFHAPHDKDKFLVYCDAIHEYDLAYKRALKLAEADKIDKAVAEFEQAYTYWRKAMANNDYDLGARLHLRASGLSVSHPTALADRYSKMLAKADRKAELVAFAERYFRDFGPPYSNGEEALRKRADRARSQI